MANAGLANRADADWADGYAVRGDTVVRATELLALLRTASVADLAEFGGSFCAVLRQPDHVVAISDRVGSRPLYRALGPTGWLMSSDFWGLAAALGAARPSPEAAVELLAFGYVMGEATVSDRILEIPPGSRIELWPDGRAVTQTYWRYRHEPRERSGARLVSELATVFDGMAERSLRAGKLMGLDHWGVNLSAGKDSRVLLAGLLKAGVPVTAYSSVRADDAEVAARLTALVGVPHRISPFWTDVGSPWVPQIADPLIATTIPSVAGHPISVAVQSPPECSGLVSGHLADNFSGGIWSIQHLRARGASDTVARARLARGYERLQRSDLLRVLRPEWHDLAGHPAHRLSEVIEGHDPDAVIRVDLEQRKRRYILRDYLALRALGPSILWFGDPAWADFWATVPTRWLLGSPLYERVLAERTFRDHAAPLARVPVNRQPLRRVRAPRLAFARRDLLRRARKHLGQPAPTPSARDSRYRPTADELDLASWLIEPDYFATQRGRIEVDTLRTIARATALMAGASPDVPQAGSE